MAIFQQDNIARSSKRGGAWMSVLRGQSRGVIPLVLNNNNFAKGDPTLLSVDDVRTLFHEFGHGLHGMLSDVEYERALQFVASYQSALAGENMEAAEAVVRAWQALCRVIIASNEFVYVE